MDSFTKEKIAILDNCEVATLTYLYRKSDGTNELRDEKVDAASFKKVVSDDLVEIIW